VRCGGHPGPFGLDDLVLPAAGQTLEERPVEVGNERSGKLP
jgi:hypothetical protein